MTLPKIASDFQANWEAPIDHLKPAMDINSCPKDQIRSFILKRLFIDAITFGLAPYIRTRLSQLNDLANKNILPAAHLPFETLQLNQTNFDHFWHGPIDSSNQQLRDHFEVSAHTITTPHNWAKLNANLFRHRDADGSTPTLIYFQPNGCVSTQESHRWLLQKSIDMKTPMNFVIFDYRSVGDSIGTFKSTNDLIVDGASIVQWVRNELGTPDDRIHFYGRSLGGAIAAQTKALYPNLTGRFISERSFSSSYDMISRIVHDRFKPNLHPMLRPLCYLLAPLAAWAVKSQGYNLDAVKAFKKLQGEKLVVYHPQDPVIPFNASLFSKVKNHPHKSLELRTDEFLINHHNSPLSFYKNAEEEIASVIFK